MQSEGASPHLTLDWETLGASPDACPRALSRSPRSPSLPLRPTLASFIRREVSSHVLRKLFWEVHVAVNSAHLPFTV